jgi:CRP/FNR family cyclic AMP-dependent transcriptional regulator
MTELTELLGRFPLFENFRKEDLKAIAPYFEEVSLRQDQVLFREGEPGEFMGFILEGSLQVLQQNTAGKEILLNTVNKGRSFGEVSLLDQSPRSATIKASADSRLIVLRRTGFDAIMEHRPKIGVAVLMGISWLVCQHLRKQSSRLVELL